MNHVGPSLSTVTSVPVRIHFPKYVITDYIDDFRLTGTLGAMGDTEAAHKEMLEVPTLVQRKNNQIEQFVLRRVFD